MVDRAGLRELLQSVTAPGATEAEILHAADEFFASEGEDLEVRFLRDLLQHPGEAAVRVAEEYAYAGSVAAQVLLGSLKFGGEQVERNPSEGLFWLRRAFNAGSPRAGLLLAGVYAGGIGVAVDLIQARAYARMAAESGLPKAQYCYATMLISGDGGPVDEATALEYLISASEGGCPEALQLLRDNDLGPPITPLRLIP